MASIASGLLGAGISTVGSLIGLGGQKNAIREAAAAQENAATNAASLEKQATDKANQYTEGNLASIQANEQPYQTAATGALSQLSAGTAPGGQFNSTPTGEQVMAQDPGYAFRLGQGQEALERAEAAGGGVGSGGALKAGAQYGQDYASNEYQNAFQRFQQNRQTNYSNLAGLVNYGQNANQVDANAGTSASGLVANTTMQGTQAQTNYLTDSARAEAAGDIGVANAQSDALGSIGKAAQTGLAQTNLNRSGYGGGSSGSQFAAANYNLTPTSTVSPANWSAYNAGSLRSIGNG